MVPGTVSCSEALLAEVVFIRETKAAKLCAVLAKDVTMKRWSHQEQVYIKQPKGGDYHKQVGGDSPHICNVTGDHMTQNFFSKVMGIESWNASIKPAVTKGCCCSH